MKLHLIEMCIFFDNTIKIQALNNVGGLESAINVM